MELNNPVIQTLLGLVIFYIGLKMFSGGMKAMGNIDHLQWFLGNPIYMFFGGIVMTLLWQSSSLSTTAIIGLVAGILLFPSPDFSKSLLVGVIFPADFFPSFVSQSLLFCSFILATFVPIFTWKLK